MKTRILLTLSAILLLSTALVAQKEKTQFTMKAYLPVQFDAGNYQMGTYTWGRWHVPGLELGLNLKKKRFEQEFILGSPRSESTRYFHERDRDSVSTYYIIDDMIQTSVSLSYQAGYSVYTSKSGKFNIVPGLGMALHANFIKSIHYYDDAPGVIDMKMQIATFSPYLFTTFRYDLNEKWGIEGTVMYKPYYAMYWRDKTFYGGNKEVRHDWFSSDFGTSVIYSRFGVSYKF